MRPRPFEIIHSALAVGLLLGMTIFSFAALATYLSGDSPTGAYVLGGITFVVAAGASLFDDLRKPKGPWS
jgi:Mg/Co/Ni transporter MgtE